MRKLKIKPVTPSVPPVLNAEQTQAVAAITSAQGFAPFLLFGVTGSGKTEVYLTAMQAALKRDPEAQVLLLVPEINLTPQLEKRVRSRFAEETVVTLHSKLALKERAANWLAVHEGRARVLVGTRLSIFASFMKLALILVDEEHDASYKAGDGIYYSARDLAVKRAHSLGITCVLDVGQSKGRSVSASQNDDAGGGARKTAGIETHRYTRRKRGHRHYGAP